MKTLIGGGAAAVLGIIGMSIWWKPFMQLLAGSIPAALLLGGGLAIYLGFDELKDTWKSKKEEEVGPSFKEEEVEKYKKEVNELKDEIKVLKKGEKKEK